MHWRAGWGQETEAFYFFWLIRSIPTDTCVFQSRLLFLQGWGLNDLPLRASFSPRPPTGTHETCHLPLRGPSEAARCASTEDHQAPYPHPSKLDRLLPSGMAPVSVLLRPSSEHILIVRAPGAKDRYGCYSLPFSWQGTTRHSAGHDRWRATGRFLPIDADYRDSTLPRR